MRRRSFICKSSTGKEMREEQPITCKSPVATRLWSIHEVEWKTMCLQPIKEDGCMVHSDSGDTSGVKIQMTKRHRSVQRSPWSVVSVYRNWTCSRGTALFQSLYSIYKASTQTAKKKKAGTNSSLAFPLIWCRCLKNLSENCLNFSVLHSNRDYTKKKNAWQVK